MIRSIRCEAYTLAKRRAYLGLKNKAKARYEHTHAHSVQAHTRIQTAGSSVSLTFCLPLALKKPLSLSSCRNRAGDNSKECLALKPIYQTKRLVKSQKCAIFGNSAYTFWLQNFLFLLFIFQILL